MILGVGIDQIQIDRIRDVLEERPERARERLFTSGERRRCEERARPFECYAARFAAKEAFLKAVGTGWRDGLSWTEIEVETGPRGQPRLILHGTAADRAREMGTVRTHLSFTHEGGSATAVVVLEG